MYYIGIGSGEVVGAICCCLVCGSEWLLQTGTVQRTVSQHTNLPIDDLIEETFPRLPIVYGERLAQEETLRRDPFALDADTRLEFIAEPFFLLDNTMLEYEQKTPSWERVVCTLGSVAAVFFGIVTLATFLDATDTANKAVAWGFLIATIAIIWGTVVLNRKGKQRFVREKIYPRLALCLAPVCPTTDEMVTVLANIESDCANLTVTEELLPLLKDNRTTERARA